MDVPKEQPEPPVWAEYRRIVKENGYDLSLQMVERFSFYEEVAKDDVALIIQTGELREYANILLTVGSL